MEKAIDYISINDLFWIQIKEHLVSFGFKGLPKDVHFTVSFNGEHTVNFHVTKNVDTFESKPKIGIIEIKKEDIERLMKLVNKKFLQMMLKPFDINEFKNKNGRRVGFLSFEKVQGGNTGRMMENKLKEIFEPISKLQRKSRFKIKGNLEQAFNEDTFPMPLLKKMIRQVKPLNYRGKKLIEGGTLISKEAPITVIRVGDKWFEFVQPELKKILPLIVGEEIARKIKRRLMRSIVLVKNANSYSDVEKYRKTPILYFKDS